MAVRPGRSQRAKGVASTALRSPVEHWLWAAIVAGMLARLALAAVSLGTNDAAAFTRFADEIAEHGLIATYRIDPDFNHPAIPALWAYATRALAGDSDLLFTFLFKLAPIGADVLVLYLLWKIWDRRGDRRRTLWVMAGFAWSLDAILVSGFHCNTDPCYAALCLLAAYLIEEHGWHFWGGVALAGAINVKIIPVLLIPPLLANCRTWPAAAKFVGGLALGVIPFLPALVLAPAAFARNVLVYNSRPDRWGVNLLLISTPTAFDFHVGVGRAAWWYNSNGRYIVFAAMAAWAVMVRFRGRWRAYDVCAVTFAVFLLLAPGFGVQYTVILGGLLFAVRPRLAIVYGSLTGAFLAGVYYATLQPRFPLYSHFNVIFPLPAALVGAGGWATLAAYVVLTLRRGSPALPAAAAAPVATA